jgi:hypothetical protein
MSGDGAKLPQPDSVIPGGITGVLVVAVVMSAAVLSSSLADACEN